MSHSVLLSILLLAPFFGFLFNGLRFKSKNVQVAGVVGTAMVGISFICSVLLFSQLASLPEAERSLRAEYWNWLNVAGLQIPLAFVVDQLSAVMILVITGIGTLIHLFSIGYMSHDERPSKYFSYLNFFVFNMLLLVLGDNLVLMFFGWEGVGLASYLLIGFWFTDKEKAAAGMKAFVTNRIGDAGFLIGLFLLFGEFGSIVFETLNAQAPTVQDMSWNSNLTLACIALFIGACGKSAQIPLYVWLPDAMAGPTPVSALIHAATMVTAGVYMICRLSNIFIAAPNALFIVAIIGALTLLMAASIGLTQWDIKKVLAYSTVSQLGYMFLAVGVGAFNAAMFHLVTHAFFKALMFLGSGSVIHAMHEEQDIRKMGGLKKHMPVTHWTFVAGWLAIIGTPLFSGFMSKDEILWMSWHSPLGSWYLWLMGVAGAGMTAFYMTRLMALTFWGESRVPSDVHPHESPTSMTLPLIVLGVLSVFGGFLGIPHVLGKILPGHPPNFFEHWLDPRLANIPGLAQANITMEWIGIAISVTTAAVGAILAYRFYIIRKDLPEKVTSKIKGLYELVYNKYWVDEFYFGRIINPIVEMSKGLWMYIDVNFIDKITYWTSDMVKGAGSSVRSMQSGNIQQYALLILLGVVVVIFAVVMG